MRHIPFHPPLHLLVFLIEKGGSRSGKTVIASLKNNILGQREISPNGMRVCEVPKHPPKINYDTFILSSAKKHPQKIH
jgi:hypothetical protein